MAGIVTIWDGYYPSDVYCGAALIDNCFLITAAHCTDGSILDEMFVVLGNHIGRGDGTTEGEELKYDDGTYIKVEQIYQHPQFDNWTYENDLSILKLETCVEFNSKIAPICLPSNPGQRFIGHAAIVTGWGTTSFDGPEASTLMEVEMPIIVNWQCSWYYYNIVPGMLCADGSDQGKDSCQGDSGGNTCPKYEIPYQKSTLWICFRPLDHKGTVRRPICFGRHCVIWRWLWRVSRSVHQNN